MSGTAKSRGFTLLELMLVITVVGILSTIAIPSYLNSRKSANEGAAIGSLRLISTAQEIHVERFGSYATLDDLIARNLIDSTFAAPSRRGYVFSSSSVGVDQWSVNADPENPGSSGNNYFFVNELGVIRESASGPATASDPPVG